MNARYYNPKTVRFLSQDTYKGSAYDPWTQHLYAYIGNNPINFIDPTGHVWEDTGQYSGYGRSGVPNRYYATPAKKGSILYETRKLLKKAEKKIIEKLFNSKGPNSPEFKKTLVNHKEESGLYVKAVDVSGDLSAKLKSSDSKFDGVGGSASVTLTETVYDKESFNANLKMGVAQLEGRIKSDGFSVGGEATIAKYGTSFNMNFFGHIVQINPNIGLGSMGARLDIKGGKPGYEILTLIIPGITGGYSIELK